MFFQKDLRIFRGDNVSDYRLVIDKISDFGGYIPEESYFGTSWSLGDHWSFDREVALGFIDDSKKYGLLLEGVLKESYFNEKNIMIYFIRNMLYPEEKEIHIDSKREINLKRICFREISEDDKNWECKQFETLLLKGGTYFSKTFYFKK